MFDDHAVQVSTSDYDTPSGRKAWFSSEDMARSRTTTFDKLRASVAALHVTAWKTRDKVLLSQADSQDTTWGQSVV